LDRLNTISIFVVEADVGSYQMLFWNLYIYGIYLPSSFQTLCALIHYTQQLQNSWSSL